MRLLIIGLILLASPSGIPVDWVQVSKACIVADPTSVRNKAAELIAIPAPSYDVVWLARASVTNFVSWSESDVAESVGRLFPYRHPRKWVDPPV